MDHQVWNGSEDLVCTNHPDIPGSTGGWIAGDEARTTGRETMTRAGLATEEELDSPRGDSAPRRSGGVLLSEVRPERVRWLSRGRLPVGKLTELVGDPGLGKSTLAYAWAAAISRGLALPDGQPEQPRGVVVLASEDGLADTVRPRLEAADADLTRIFALTETSESRGYSIPNDVGLIEEAIQRMDAAILVIDPLVAFLGRDVNAHHDQDVRRALKPLKEMGERTGCTILSIRHLNKTQTASAMYRASGSIAFTAAARSALLVAADPDNPEVRVLASIKSNVGKPAPSLSFRLEDVPGSQVARVVYLGTSHHTSDTLLAVPQANEPRPSKRDEAVAWLRARLASGPVSQTVLQPEAEAAGISWATVRRAREQLGCASRKTGFGKGWVWELPEAKEDDAEAF